MCFLCVPAKQFAAFKQRHTVINYTRKRREKKLKNNTNTKVSNGQMLSTQKVGTFYYKLLNFWIIFLDFQRRFQIEFNAKNINVLKQSLALLSSISLLALTLKTAVSSLEISNSIPDGTNQSLSTKWQLHYKAFFPELEQTDIERLFKLTWFKYILSSIKLKPAREKT